MSQGYNSSGQPVVIHQRPSLASGCLMGLMGFFAKLFIAFIVLAIFFAFIGHFYSGDLETGVTEKHVSGDVTAHDKVAIITLSGVILGEEDGNFIKQLDAAEKDPHVKAVVLRINSPGGTVSGSDYFHYKILQFEKKKDVPIVTSMGNMATSGGYYLAVTGDELFAERTTTTGSIGVIAGLYDLSELCEKIGVKSNPITSGPMKSMGDPTRKMTEQEKEVFQNLVDDMFKRFLEVVEQGRPNFQQNPEKLRELADGRVYTATQAIENGLIDKIGFIEDAVKRAAELAELPEDSYKVVKFQPPKTAMEILMGTNSNMQSNPAISPELINNLAAPQFYYILPRAMPVVNPE